MNRATAAAFVFIIFTLVNLGAFLYLQFTYDAKALATGVIIFLATTIIRNASATLRELSKEDEK